MSPDCKEQRIDCSWGQIYIKLWNANSTLTPIIALHGWLDNCQSFSPLAQFIDNPIIAIDLPGHGLSENLPDGNWYHFADYIIRVKEIIDKLGTSNFHLMGHSMGAAIAALYASLYPDNISNLILIDGMGPMINEPHEAHDILKNAILNREKQEKKKDKVYPNLELAIKARMTAGKISHRAAEILVTHQMLKTNEVFTWTYDPKLTLFSPLRMTEQQLASFLTKITTNTLLIKPDLGFIEKAPFWHLRDLIKNLTVQTVSGGHHCHMDAPEETAKIINAFS